MNYEEAIQKLFSKRPARFYTGQDDFIEAIAKIGSPHTSYPVVHVAGTNGKGSVSFKIAKALELSGYRVGLFTSPHLISFCERIVVGSQPISEEKVLKELIALFKTAPRICFFELAALIAFSYFKEQKVDIAVIEAGIGGLFDTTNIIHPVLSVITSIAMDHENILGGTLEKIAHHKAGIIKRGVPVVAGPSAGLASVRERARIFQSPFYQVEPQKGYFDLENSAIARQALEVLKPLFPIRNEAALDKGLLFRPPCRFEQAGRVIFDVAHNPAGFQRLLEAMELHFPGRRFSAIVGMSGDKDVKMCLSLLAQRADFLYLVRTPALKSLSAEAMGQMLRQDGFTRFTAELSLADSLNKALEGEELIVVCGSFYIMKEARDEVLRIEVGHDNSFLAGGQLLHQKAEVSTVVI